MTTPASFRDSAQGMLSRGVLEGVCEAIESRFTVTIRETDTAIGIVGSPVEIKTATRLLA